MSTMNFVAMQQALRKNCYKKYYINMTLALFHKNNNYVTNNYSISKENRFSFSTVEMSIILRMIFFVFFFDKCVMISENVCQNIIFFFSLFIIDFKIQKKTII